MSKKLRECPFCGGEDVEHLPDGFGNWLVGCVTCDYRIQCVSCTEDDAIRYWNTRPAEDANDKEIDSLVLCLAKIKFFCKKYHDYYTEREKTDIPELKPLDKYMIDWCDYIIETINSTCSGKGTNDDSAR